MSARVGWHGAEKHVGIGQDQAQVKIKSSPSQEHFGQVGLARDVQAREAEAERNDDDADHADEDQRQRRGHL